MTTNQLAFSEGGLHWQLQNYYDRFTVLVENMFILYFDVC